MTRRLLLLCVLLPVIAAGVTSSARAADDAPPPVHAAGTAPGAPPLSVSPPLVALDGVAAVIGIETGADHLDPAMPLEIRDSGGSLLGVATLGAALEDGIPILLPSRGSHDLLLRAPDDYAGPLTFTLRSVPGWLTLLPPLLAILIALVFRQVVPALLAGVWVGAWIGYGGPFTGMLRALDGFVIDSLVSRDHVSIIVFSILLGGMVGVMSRSGGTQGLVESLSRLATTAARGQVVTWLLGIAIFFDDYANTLVVGNTMRPVTDRLKISREKLAYIVDCTAAPVASIALVSTWIGFEVSLIGDALEAVGSKEDAYWIFVQSIPYRFYPVLALILVVLLALARRDFGPMLAAERRAARGLLSSEKAQPLSDFDSEALRPVQGRPHRWINAAVPVLTVVVVTFVAQWISGRASLAAGDDPLASIPLTGLSMRGLGAVFSAGNSFEALLYASAAGCLVAILLARLQGVLGLSDALRAWTEGMKTMVPAIVILTLAWAIGKVCTDLHTAGFLVQAMSGRLDPRLLPALVFLLASLISFATGSSWSTMSILVPLAVPSAYGLAQAAAFDTAGTHLILLGAVSSVLAGAVFGDHCSPISDTTIMSSMASGCDHVDHVRTQLPYALVVAAAGVTFGDLPTSYGLSPWLAILLASVALGLIVRFVGRRVGT